MKIIALCGEKQCGKSTLSSHLAKHHGFTVLSFADPLYAMLTALIGKDARTIPKEVPLTSLGGKTLRHALQTLGTEWGRGHIYEDLWLDHLYRKVEGASDDAKFVIDDARFPNEFETLCRFGATMVTIRSGKVSDGDSHVSERGWKDIHPDYSFLNDHSAVSADEFCETAAALLGEHT